MTGAARKRQLIRMNLARVRELREHQGQGVDRDGAWSGRKLGGLVSLSQGGLRTPMRNPRLNPPLPPRDTGVQPRQGEVQVHGGLNAWWQTHTECFTQEKSADNQSWQRATESRPKRPRQAGPGVLQGVQETIVELVEKGYRMLYTDGPSKRLGHKDMRRAGGFGVFAAEDDQGPEVRFCGYVPTHYRQTNNGAELWAAVEA